MKIALYNQSIDKKKCEFFIFYNNNIYIYIFTRMLFELEVPIPAILMFEILH